MRVTANVVRSGGWWAVEVPEVPGLFTQAKRLDQVAAMVVEAASLLDVEVEEADVTITPRLADEEAALVQAAKDRRAALRDAEAEAAAASRQAVTRLRGDGLPVRDVAALLGVTPQRVSQLAAH